MSRGRIAALIAAGLLAVAAPAAGAAHHTRKAGCHVPRLTGRSLAAARKLAATAGCRLTVTSAGGQGPNAIKLVSAQRPAAGTVATAVAVSLQPLCFQSAAPGPPDGEPLRSPGPTELVSGLYLDGGPLTFSPRCRSGIPSAGTITVVDPSTNATVATATVAQGHLGTIPLAPGTYAIEGTFGNATSNNQPITTPPQTVTVIAGQAVRQDVVANIP